MERIKELTAGWFGRIVDLVNCIKDAGYSVEDVNGECITAWDDNDNFYTLYLGGTERTIVVERITKETI